MKRMTAKEYLLEMGFDDEHLPKLFNDDDKSYYKIIELMEEYHQAKLKLLHIADVVNQRELLLDFADYSERDKTSETTDECVDNYLDSIK